MSQPGNGRTTPPTVDDSRVVHAVQEYLQSLESGQATDRETFLKAHSEIADVLADCLDGLDFVHSAAPGLQTSDDEAASAEFAEQMRRTPLGDFRIIREVGRGGMGIVYEAEQLSLGRRVALKVLPLASVLNPRQLHRFKHEAQAAAHLHHTHIVPVHGIGCERGIHYYAMQFIEGQSLAQVIHDLREHRAANQDEAAVSPSPSNVEKSDAASTAPPTDRVTDWSGSESTRYRMAAQWGVQAAEALAYAHGEGIIHRDIKPANLLVDGQGRLWITDFGLARLPGDPALTMSGDLVGTLRYMSPEQASARPGNVDHRTDVYALGVTLYELLALEPAVPGIGRAEILRRLSSDEPIPLRRHDRRIPTELETIVLKAIAKDADLRYATAQEFAEDLHRFLEDRPIHARRPTVVQRLTKWTRRHRSVVRVVMVATLLALIGMSAGLIVLWRQREQTRAALHAEGVERQRAEENWRLAREALDAIYLQSAERQFFRDPQREREDRQTLEQALDFYERFIEANGAHHAVRHETAKAHLRVGEIHQRLGRTKRAEEAFRRSISLLEELHAEAPENESYRRDLAASVHRLGVRLSESGKFSEAEEVLQTALQHRKALVAAAVDSDKRHELALTWNVQALVFHRAGRHADAETAWKEALSLHATSSAERPDILRYRSELASVKHNLASLKLNLGRLQDAEPLLREALELRRQLVKASDLPVYRQKLAVTHHNLGIMFKITLRLDEAESEYREAIAAGAQLVNEFPTVPDLRYDLAGYYDHLGNVLTDLKRYEEAGETYGKAHGLIDKLVTEFPTSPKYRELQGIHILNRGVLSMTTDKFSEAEEFFQQAETIWKKLLDERPGVASYRQYLDTTQKNLTQLDRRRKKSVTG